MKVMQLPFYLLLGVTVLLFLHFGLHYFTESSDLFIYKSKELIDVLKQFAISDNIEFGGFDNETGFDRFIVPNIVHYIRLDKRSWTFVEYICLLSAYVNQRPDYIVIHTNVENGFRGKYWKKIQQHPNLKLVIVVVLVQVPSEIFGQKLNSNYKIYHASDIIRIQTLMKYGGIFFDNDVYVVQNLDKYRKFEMTLGWPKNNSLGSMVLMGHKNARFLPLWLDNYRDYKADQWYHNAGDNPTKKILMENPEFVHRVESRLGIHFLMREIFQTKDFLWCKRLDAVHLLINHRFYLDYVHKDYRYFNERNILHYPFKFGEMARLVLNHSLLQEK